MKSKNAAKDVIHVVLSVYDPKGTYSQQAGVVMTSIFERTKSPVCVHILHDETLTERNRAFLSETAELFGQLAEFHDVALYLERIGDHAVNRAQKTTFSVGSMFRLFIPDILPLDKVIYLDCDVVVNLDIRELWDIPLDDRSLAGVIERPAPKPFGRFSLKALRLKLMKCDRMNYINAGVLVMNLSRMRHKLNLIQESRLWYKRYGHLTGGVDQDLINSFFRGDIKPIDSRFNCRKREGDISESILHMFCAPKPWIDLDGSAVQRIYWKACLKTPWGRLSSEEVVDVMLDIVKSSSLTHRHTAQCYRRIFYRFMMDIILNDVTVMLWLLGKDTYYRIKRFLTRGEPEK